MKAAVLVVWCILSIRAQDIGIPKEDVRAIAGTPSGIVYTCDPEIAALPGVCDTLNTTISKLYSSTFTNANANIYVKFGTTNFASSSAFFNGMSYANFRNALHSSITDANDLLAFTSSVPPVNPIDS